MLTLIQQPSQVTPAYNPINFVVSSNNVAQPSFQFVFDLYIAGVFISRHRLPPKTFTGVARLDVSAIVKSYLTQDMVFSSTAFDRTPNSWTSLYIRFGEEYAVAGVLTTYINLLDSATCYAVNASLEYLQFVNWSSNTFYQGTTRKFLTSNATPNILDNNKMWLHFYHELPANITSILIRVYNSFGTQINSNSFVPTDLSNSTIGDRFLKIAVGTSQLKALFGSTFFVNASYYTVQAVDATSSFSLEIKTINIQESNCKYENVALHFLNVYGGFDVFNFKLVSNKNSSIDRKKYNVMSGSFNSSNVYGYASADRSTQVMTSSNQDSLTVNSDWITEAESTWLKELITSPVVFMEVGSGLVPISISETKYKFSKKVNEKIFNLQVTFDFGNENFRQTY